MKGGTFRFKQFTVCQERAAMKVGTDGTLLGAWAAGGRRILDVGTGTGLIALLMAQRFSDARVVAIDIEPQACGQALENVKASPFSRQISVLNLPLQQYHSDALFDAIVCNPPFFAAAMKSPDAQRSLARHADSLSFQDLCLHSRRLLTPVGTLSVIIPCDSLGRMETAAAFACLHIVKRTFFHTAPVGAPRRVLLALSPTARAEEVGALHIHSAEYRELTRPFYIE